MQPLTTIKIVGNISDFNRIDNLYSALKRESGKLLSNWIITMDVNYQEKQKPNEDK